MEYVDKAKQFFNEARQELKKVTWPNKQRIATSTWVVLAMVIFMAIFFGIADYGLGKLIKYILKLG
ncbi:MAG: preprotein translocase subunit SecE [Thermodesulfobacteriota bacterium]